MSDIHYGPRTVIAAEKLDEDWANTAYLVKLLPNYEAELLEKVREVVRDELRSHGG